MAPRTKSDPTIGLIDVLLDQAQEALATDNYADAKKHFQEALDLRGSDPKLPERIRALLKQHCDQHLATEQPPPWNSVMPSLALFTELPLHDDESQLWGRAVHLNYTTHLLSQNDVASCFKQFKEILECCPDDNERREVIHAEIVPQIRTHISRLVDQSPRWDSLNDIVEQLEQLGPDVEEDLKWLETIRAILNAAEKEGQKLYVSNLFGTTLIVLTVMIIFIAALAIYLF